MGMSGTIIGGIVGFVGAVLPEVFGLVRQWIASRTPNVTVVNNPVPCAAPAPDTSYSSYEDSAGPEFDADAPIHYRLLDILRVSVRPVVTYVFFAAFVLLKWVVLKHALLVDHAKAVELLPILWDEGTETLFAAIMAFWFGSRMMVRYRRRT